MRMKRLAQALLCVSLATSGAASAEAFPPLVQVLVYIGSSITLPFFGPTTAAVFFSAAQDSEELNQDSIHAFQAQAQE